MKLLLRRFEKITLKVLLMVQEFLKQPPCRPFLVHLSSRFALCRNPRYRLLVDNSLFLKKLPLDPVRPVGVFWILAMRVSGGSPMGSKRKLRESPLRRRYFRVHTFR